MSFQIMKKASQSFVCKDEIKLNNIFCAGMYEAKNTNRAASVEFDRYQRSNYARSSPAVPIASAGASLSKCSVGVFWQTRRTHRKMCPFLHEKIFYSSTTVTVWPVWGRKTCSRSAVLMRRLPSFLQG